MLYIEQCIIDGERVSEEAISDSHLSVESAPQNASVVVQLVCYCRAIDFHASSEDNKLIPLTDHLQEEVHMGPFMHKESDWVPVYNNLKTTQNKTGQYGSFIIVGYIPE